MTIIDAMDELRMDGVLTKIESDGSILMQIRGDDESPRVYSEDEFLGFCDYYFDTPVIG